MTKVLPALDKRFRLEEATIGELHAAIKAEDDHLRRRGADIYCARAGL